VDGHRYREVVEIAKCSYGDVDRDRQTAQATGFNLTTYRRDHQFVQSLSPGPDLLTPPLRFPTSHADKPDEGGGPCDEELQRVPGKKQSEDVQPSRTAPLGQTYANEHRKCIRAGEKHCRQAPFETATGVDRVQRDIGRHEPPQDMVSAGR
jgi:hypothetical protein